MKTILLSLIAVLIFSTIVYAGNLLYETEKNDRPYRDSWGNSYKYQDNLYKDTDRDGVPNYYDYNDRNPRIQNPYQRDYDSDMGFGSGRSKRRSKGLLD